MAAPISTSCANESSPLTNNSTPTKFTDVAVISYNMHGFNQGSNLLSSLCDAAEKPDVIFLQEHWLTPANLPKLVNFSSNYTLFGISAMESALCHGIL